MHFMNTYFLAWIRPRNKLVYGLLLAMIGKCITKDSFTDERHIKIRIITQIITFCCWYFLLHVKASNAKVVNSIFFVIKLD